MLKSIESFFPPKGGKHSQPKMVAKRSSSRFPIIAASSHLLSPKETILTRNLNGKTTSTKASTAAAKDLLKKYVDTFQLLSDSSRLRMVLIMLKEGEQHVNAFCDRLKQPQPAISFHLKRLYQHGLLQRRRDGKFCFYSLASQFEKEMLHPIFSKDLNKIRLDP